MSTGKEVPQELLASKENQNQYIPRPPPPAPRAPLSLLTPFALPGGQRPWAPRLHGPWAPSPQGPRWLYLPWLIHAPWTQPPLPSRLRFCRIAPAARSLFSSAAQEARAPPPSACTLDAADGGSSCHRQPKMSICTLLPPPPAPGPGALPPPPASPWASGRAAEASRLLATLPLPCLSVPGSA